MIASVRSKALKRFWTKSDAGGLRPDWVRRIDRQLTLLDQAISPEDMDVVTTVSTLSRGIGPAATPSPSRATGA